MKSITYSREFYEIKFSDVTMKEAYMKACRWYASNVISNRELKNVQVEFEKIKDEQNPTIIVHLYAVLDEEELRERHCKICREFHSLFYINEKYNCNNCDTKAYQQRADDLLRNRTEYFRELLLKKK